MSAVPFLLDLFRIPADTFQLFLATGVINSRVGTLVAAVHTLTVALLGTCAITGMLRVRKGARAAVPRDHRRADRRWSLAARARCSTGICAPSTRRTRCSARCTCCGPRRPPRCTASRSRRTRQTTGPVLQSIRERGVLRVGYMPDALPFAFFNTKGDLVGLDVELAHRLASELGVGLEFVPVDRERLAEELSSNCCDIVMAGVAVTTLRAAQVLFSATYLDETLAFVVPDHSRELFSSWDDIRAADVADHRGARRAVLHRQAPREGAARRAPRASRTT